MSIHVSELTENDYKILEYINRFDSVHKNQIQQHFNNRIDALDYRLSVLSHIDGKVSGGSYLPLTNSSWIEEEFENEGDDHGNYESLNSFHITPLGKSALQDYKSAKKADAKRLWLKNAWIPIIVSFVTTNISMYLIPRLPQILKWLCDTLSRIFSH